MRTCQSDIRVAQVARTQAFLDETLVEVAREVVREAGYIAQEMTIDVAEGQTLALEKLCCRSGVPG